MKPVLKSKPYHQYLFIFLIQLAFAFVIIIYSNFKKDVIITSDCSASLLTSQKEVDFVVLLWTWPFGAQFPLNECKKPFNTPRCYMTANRSWYSRADAVIFHHRDVCESRNHMPQIPRPEGQYWLWFNLESPSNSPNLSYMDNLMNLTMSYRSDSDIFSPYGWLQKKDFSHNFTIPKKSKLVAWVISNWNPQSKRVQFYKTLKKHINIDVYGRQHLPLDVESRNTVISQYKFYLAFENSLHKDYISEKLWRNALLSGTVPIVLGPPRENYERFIPSDSFIHVDDFPSAKELADCLLELNENSQKYEQYFSWRTKLSPVGNIHYTAHYCRACVALHKAPSYRTLPHLSKWYT
ncbi:3-galactosyl-N-acetylglucosaminide 4-alpha-L-fucosyltransferase FUT3-like [Pseudophryne corroboree]|uniref:3-galactosyl-N-acetylglucosaminide 4-alpha-L-fucosyltransferase FUT3-like n=1 Tax=Pseudophryne corroboree TaxID=495146 RepID=UPI0030818842